MQSSSAPPASAASAPLGGAPEGLPALTLHWGGHPVVWPVQITVDVDPDDTLGVEARLCGADGQILARFPATLEEVIQGEATAAVVGRAAAMRERMAGIWTQHQHQAGAVETAAGPVSAASAFAPLAVGASLGVSAGLALGSITGGMTWALPLAFTGGQAGWWWSWHRLCQDRPPRWWPAHWHLNRLVRLRQQERVEAAQRGAPDPVWVDPPLQALRQIAPLGVVVGSLIAVGQLLRGSPWSILGILPGLALWHWGLRDLARQLARLPEAPNGGARP